MLRRRHLAQAQTARETKGRQKAHEARGPRRDSAGGISRRAARQWRRRRVADLRTPGAKLGDHVVDIGGRRPERCQTQQRVCAARFLPLAPFQSRLDGLANPCAFGGSSTLRRVLNAGVQLLGNQELQTMAHMSMLTCLCSVLQVLAQKAGRLSLTGPPLETPAPEVIPPPKYSKPPRASTR